MNVSRSQHGQVIILVVQGPLVEEHLEDLDAQLDNAVKEGVVRIVLDLKETPFIDSAGLERIQDMVSDMGKRGGDVRIASLNDVCRDIFSATRMESFVQVYEDRESAVRSLL